jgi:hypothetical protein
MNFGLWKRGRASGPAGEFARRFGKAERGESGNQEIRKKTEEMAWWK